MSSAEIRRLMTIPGVDVRHHRVDADGDDRTVQPARQRA